MLPRFPLLKPGEEGEEEDPEDAHGVPVPGDAVYEDLAGFEAARDVEADKCREQGPQAEEEVYCVDARDEVEEVAALVGAEEDVLCGELMPGAPLSKKED